MPWPEVSQEKGWKIRMHEILGEKDSDIRSGLGQQREPV